MCKSRYPQKLTGSANFAQHEWCVSLPAAFWLSPWKHTSDWGSEIAVGGKVTGFALCCNSGQWRCRPRPIGSKRQNRHYSWEELSTGLWIIAQTKYWYLFKVSLWAAKCHFRSVLTQVLGSLDPLQWFWQGEHPRDYDSDVATLSFDAWYTHGIFLRLAGVNYWRFRHGPRTAWLILIRHFKLVVRSPHLGCEILADRLLADATLSILSSVVLDTARISVLQIVFYTPKVNFHYLQLKKTKILFSIF